MSVIEKAMAMAARYLPDTHSDPLLDARGYVGRPMNRVDGPEKVTGAARFAAEYPFERLSHAVLVCSRIARGRVTRIDTAAAEAAPGVIAVMTHANVPRLKRPSIFALR